MDLTDALPGELLEIAHTRSKFAAFVDERVVDSPPPIVRYGLGSIESFRTAGEMDRGFLFLRHWQD